MIERPCGGGQPKKRAPASDGLHRLGPRGICSRSASVLASPSDKGEILSNPGAMTRDEREAFLADVHVGILAVDEPGRGPLAIPIWYLYRDGTVQIGMDGDSLKARLLRAAGRATLTAQTEAPPYKYVCVEGPVTVEKVQRDDLEMASRYLGPELGKWYAENNPSTEQSVTVFLRPERWRTMDFGKVMG
jgi:nitroimidazol reductase NimA-like FMN-containing flavoprotein (pyridoxamine 5'-phosphate oxidase superfamily)